ncbi:Heavy metal translocatin protein [Coniochaeta hoffmannii]|uniref:Heavy metal translocatin protein n=1 Tax=Coniochaeta hoffmannii TaxID=91930 RepID=A0AA38VE62_9PEZI|nr:Heavy metal translocatin protein [Coniochaeta hoffmannii]
MSTAIAMAPSPAPHDRPAYSADIPAASANASPTAQRTAPSPFSAPSSVPPSNNAPAQQQQQQQQRLGSGSPRGAPPPTAKSSPPSASRNAAPPPKIIVKKEPGSPELPTARPRPRRLDLSKNTISMSGNTPQTARPSTARDGLGIQEVGLACLSPGFVTQDPVMKEQLQRSISVREHQRQIIESRLLQSAKGDGPESSRETDPFAAKTPGMSRRNKAPRGLSIVAPSHEQFANERVIQSAPLGHTFTGRHNPLPLTRHLTNQPSNLSSTSHIHHVPANQTNNRLPPIADVITGMSGHPDSRDHHMYTPHTHRGPLTSPGHPPPPPQMPTPSHRREFKSAEEAQAELAAGRPDLLPNASKRRRADYEDGGSPPLGSGRPAQRRGPFGEGRDSPETQRAKKDEFLALCSRAWDLFHT